MEPSRRHILNVIVLNQIIYVTYTCVAFWFMYLMHHISIANFFY